MAPVDDRPGRDAPHDRRIGLAGAVLLLVVAIVARAIGWGPSVINPDESIFSLAAREVVAGNLPYLTLFDNKPVGSTLILAGAFAAFGQSILLVRLVGTAFAWASGVLVATLLRGDGFSRREALVAGIVQIAFVSALELGGQATLTELLLTPFTTLAALLVQRLVAADPRAQLLLAPAAGLACGMAVLIKITPFLPGVAIAGTTLLLAVLHGRGTTAVTAVKLLVLFVVASLVPMIVTAIVYVAAGALDQFWWSNFGFARAYTADHPNISMIAQRLGTTIDGLWPLLVAMLVAVLDAAMAWQRRDRVDGLLIVALVWLAAELVTAAMSLQFYPHYFLTALAPLVVLAAFGFRAVARWTAPGNAPRVALVLGALLALIAVERTQVDMARDRLATPDIPRRVAAAIRRASGGHVPTVLVINYKLSSIYLLTGSPLPPTRFAVPAHLFTGQYKMTRADPQVEVARVLASRPEFIVFNTARPPPAWARTMFAGVAGDYRLFHADGSVRVFRRA